MRVWVTFTIVTIFTLWGLVMASKATQNKQPTQSSIESALVLPAQPHWLVKSFEPGTSYLKREGVETA